MKKILLLDSNFSSLPIFNYLIQLGYTVYTIGINKSDVLCELNKDFHFYEDYSNLFTLKNIIDKHNIDLFIPGCNDLSYEMCVKLNDYYNVIQIESLRNAQIINTKNLFRKFSHSNDIPSPKLIEVGEVNSFDRVIVKPCESYSGKGVSIIDKSRYLSSLEEGIKYAKKNSRDNNFLIEEFVEGDLFSYSCFIENKKVIEDFVVREKCIKDQFRVDTSYFDYKFSENIKTDIKTQIEKISHLLDLKDGLLHLQFILDRNSDFYFIELTRRCPGDLYSLLIQKTTNYEYIKNYVNGFLDLDFVNIIPKENYFLRKSIFSSKNKRNNKNEIYMSFTKSAKLEKSDRIGVEFLKFKTFEEVLNNF